MRWKLPRKVTREKRGGKRFSNMSFFWIENIEKKGGKNAAVVGFVFIERFQPVDSAVFSRKR